MKFRIRVTNTVSDIHAYVTLDGRDYEWDSREAAEEWIRAYEPRRRAHFSLTAEEVA